ncbi:MAG: PRD domain-containing protein [Eubacteriales bacterium]|nr:PRD domain-containing protein [Eubacteriales bacterium]
MYRVVKVLNHNAMIVLSPDKKKRLLILGKGIGFGRKTAERLELPEHAEVYSLEAASERGDAVSIVNHVDPVCLEIAGAILQEAEKAFRKVDRQIVFPMADHLSFAIQRMKSGEEIHNPLKEDIRLLFHMEYKVAETAGALVRERFGVDLTEDEIGFLALHVHTSIEDESVSQSLQTAQVVRSCISYIEEQTGQKLEVTSIGYNRMMNHIRYMVTRMQIGEEIKMNLNDYMRTKYPETYRLAESICGQISAFLRKPCQDSEIGYLAMHIARVSGKED